MLYKLTQEDMADLKIVYNAIADCLEMLPKKIIESPKFGLFVLNAFFNMIYTVAITGGLKKEDILGAFEDVWKQKNGGSKFN